jgi:hypothetical protein
MKIKNHEYRNQCLVTSSALLCYGASFIGIGDINQEQKEFIFKAEDWIDELLPKIRSGDVSVNPVVYEGNRKFLIRELSEHKKRFQ